VNQQLVSFYLRSPGISVTTVDNGRQAVQQALARDFDLIIMDMQMPDMDGLEATKKLRECGFEKPIVALTANAF